MDGDLFTVLKKVVGFLETGKYRYAIIGGLALSHWGVIRLTQDIDIKMSVPNMEYAEIRNTIRAVFPQIASSQVIDNPLIVAVEVDGIVVDFLLALPGYEENIIDRAARRDFGGWNAWVCSAEDLIIQKVTASRPKDWSDVEGLLVEQRGRLDYDYIEEWLLQFADALEKPEIFQEYRKLFEKIENI